MLYLLSVILTTFPRKGCECKNNIIHNQPVAVVDWLLTIIQIHLEEDSNFTRMLLFAAEGINKRIIFIRKLSAI